MQSFQWYDANGILFDLTDPRFTLSAFDPGGIPGIEITTTAPFQQGATSIICLLDPVIVSLEFDVVCTTLSEAVVLMQAIKTAFNPLTGIGHLYLTRDDGQIFRLDCRANRGFPYFPPAYPKRFLKSTNPWFTLQLQLQATDPFWYSGSTHLQYFPATVPAFPPLTIPWSLGSGTPSGTITNAGNVNTPVSIVLTDAMTNPVITNTTTRSGVVVTESLSLTIVMNAGDRFDIDTAFGKQTAIYTPSGGPAANGFPYINPSSEFWELQPGENNIACTFTSPAAATLATIIWSDKYVGVM